MDLKPGSRCVVNARFFGPNTPGTVVELYSAEGYGPMVSVRMEDGVLHVFQSTEVSKAPVGTTTVEQIDTIEKIDREDLSKTYAAIRRLLARTLLRDPQSSDDPAVSMSLASLQALVDRMERFEKTRADAMRKVMR